ncbi:MAG: dual specificity protein phosphatase family protein [Pyrobaculum sp.]
MNCPYWVEPRLAGSCMPKREDVENWSRIGINTVVTLAEAWELEYYGGWGLYEFQQTLLQSNIKWIHWPTPDGRPPRRLDELVELIKREVARGPVLVHCVGGIGRTPTVLAAYLISKCLKTEDAIRRVEEANPATSLTEEQYYALLEIEAIFKEVCRG